MDTKLATALGAAARVARQRTGFTQAEVAEAIGMSPEVYGRIERGAMLPSVPTLRKLARSLGVSADTLLGLDRSTSSDPIASEPRPTYGTEAPELRRLYRRLRDLDRRRLRLISLLAAELKG